MQRCTDGDWEGGREGGKAEVKTGFKKGRMESRLKDLQSNTIPSISVTERTHIQPGLYTADVLHVITLSSWSSYCLGSSALNPPAVLPTNHLYWDEEGKTRFYSQARWKQLVVPGCSEHWNEIKTVLYRVKCWYSVNGERQQAAAVRPVAAI